MYCFQQSLPLSRPPPVFFSPPNTPTALRLCGYRRWVAHASRILVGVPPDIAERIVAVGVRIAILRHPLWCYRRARTSRQLYLFLDPFSALPAFSILVTYILRPQ